MTRTMKVTGKGQIRVHPDMTRIVITLEGICFEYGEALHKSAEDTEQLKEMLSQFGFNRSDLKTLAFNVDTEYESYKQNDVYKQRFLGYKFRHLMKLEFDSDNQRLGRILYALAASPVQPEFRLGYTVKDPEKAKNLLLGKAVADAKEKAAVLASAAGITLGDIQSVDYSWGEIDFEVRPMNRTLMAEECLESSISTEGSYDLDIEPDDIDVADTVTVLWEIA